MSSKPSKDRLPFEPQQKKKKKPVKSPPKPQKSASSSPSKAKQNSIPEVVSKRMIRRMVFFSGIPTAMGVSSFFASYWVVSHELLKLPSTAVLLVSLGLFGLGVLGLSYGILSASWDEERVGSLWGGEEFSVNVGRMTAAWRSVKKEKEQKQEQKQD